MGIVGPPQERRPSINVRGNGGVYLRVYTRRGMRTRQITPEGWAWVQRKYPGHADPESIPLTYADYHQLKEQGAIFVGRRREATVRPRPTYGVPRTTGLHNDIPPSVAAASFRTATPAPSTFIPGGCPGCNRPLAVDAAYCSDCGWSKRPVAKPPEQKPTFDGICKDCNTALRTDAIFCPRCGKSRFAVEAKPVPKAAATAVAPMPAKQYGFKIGWREFLTMQVVVIGFILYLVWLAKG
jgi:ribosomal protein L37E